MKTLQDIWEGNNTRYEDNRDLLYPGLNDPYGPTDYYGDLRGIWSLYTLIQNILSISLDNYGPYLVEGFLDSIKDGDELFDDEKKLLLRLAKDHLKVVLET